MYDVYEIRKEFPIFGVLVNGKPVTYLDTTASAQKPQAVFDAMSNVYHRFYANPHRGTYYFADAITSAFEQARETVREFINARETREIVFTRNATESINLVAATWGMQNVKAGDEVLISEAEHHANLVPWQHLCEVTGAKLVVFPVDDNGEFMREEFYARLGEKTKIVAVSAMSNVLGTMFPIEEIAAAAHKVGAKVLVDACQFAVHYPIDVQKIDCDFLAFSGHKTYGPTGIGVLYGKAEILEKMPPYQFGGDMIENVTFEKTTYADIPARFEAGTPASVQAIGMAEGLKYIKKLGFADIIKHEEELIKYTTERLLEVPQLKIIGTAKKKGGVFSFAVGNIHPQDIAFVLNKENVAIRIGHHCAQPIVNRMGYNSLARASLGLYSTKEDIDNLVAALLKAEKFFREE
ncbi:MAG: SufS family cysteine desulfurase [Alphaproteobacteria bacterium]|nr:SufS family cysteine desulfurase [Alphaproteobacteria bacterium]